jgi:hypothetical protein
VRDCLGILVEKTVVDLLVGMEVYGENHREEYDEEDA